jgi:hypothetical protein
MQVVKSLREILLRNCPEIHAARMKALMINVTALLRGQELTVTALGRAPQRNRNTRHDIKQSDRLIGSIMPSVSSITISLHKRNRDSWGSFSLRNLYLARRDVFDRRAWLRGWPLSERNLMEKPLIQECRADLLAVRFGYTTGASDGVPSCLNALSHRGQYGFGLFSLEQESRGLGEKIVGIRKASRIAAGHCQIAMLNTDGRRWRQIVRRR